jgi:hypothetical protein
MAVRPIPPSDLYFTYSAFQFRALLESFDLVESNFTNLVKQRGDHWHDPSSPLAFIYRGVVDDMMPQAYRGAFLMSLWATYETTVVMVGKTLRRFDSTISGLTQPRSNWLSTMETYFARKLRIKLLPRLPRIKNELTALLLIRHALVHANGLRQITSSKNWRVLEPYVRRTPGISVGRGFLLIEPEFVRSRFEILGEAMKHVVEQGRSKLAVNPRFIEHESRN